MYKSLEEIYMNLDPNKIPNHVAMILDGNGRWAKKRMQPRTFGHRKGAYNVVDITKSCQKLGIKYITLYCFSTENWNRPNQEVNYLMTAPVRYYKKYKEKLLKTNVKLQFIGRRDRVPTALLNIMEEIEELTKDKTGITVTLCVDYGSYNEITETVKKIAQDVKDNKIAIDEITPDLIENNLFTKNLPKLDLLIRTSGECRISNFLLWQLGYAELYFTDVLWPDFNENELEKAILSYQGRNRRFGGINENK